MIDRIDIALEVPCLACGSLPEVSWEDPDWLTCTGEHCDMRIFATHFTGWPCELTELEKQKAWNAREE